jgi:hypothetical protein
MMAGCIPVFIGPPYASMPLGRYVNYDAIGTVFQALDYAEWLPRPLIKAFLSQNTARRLAPVLRHIDPQVEARLPPGKIRVERGEGRRGERGEKGVGGKGGMEVVVGGEGGGFVASMLTTHTCLTKVFLRRRPRPFFTAFMVVFFFNYYFSSCLDCLLSFRTSVRATTAGNGATHPETLHVRHRMRVV